MGILTRQVREAVLRGKKYFDDLYVIYVQILC